MERPYCNLICFVGFRTFLSLCYRWTCDCRLRSFRLWLTQSNVPRIVEPVCQGPRRLQRIHIQSLSLAEFACAPQLSPTSMYLTVPKGKNVSIVCRVSSDPTSTITWFFNGHRIHTSRTNDEDNNNNLGNNLASVSYGLFCLCLETERDAR